MLKSKYYRNHQDTFTFFRCLSATMTSWRGSMRPYDSWHSKQYQVNTPPRAFQAHTQHQHWNEPPSPQGTKRYDRNLPSSFQPDNEHFDTKHQYGLTFPRQITSTAWSQRYQLAGRTHRKYPPTSIGIHGMVQLDGHGHQSKRCGKHYYLSTHHHSSQCK